MSGGDGKEKGRGKKLKAGANAESRRVVSHRWRDYKTASGRRPVKEFLGRLDDEDLASVIAAMKEVRQQGSPSGPASRRRDL